MLYFMLGFGMGIYIGTYYDCKPFLSAIGHRIREYLPEKIEEKKDSK